MPRRAMFADASSSQLSGMASVSGMAIGLFVTYGFIDDLDDGYNPSMCLS